jgi:hypothetical protein
MNVQPIDPKKRRSGHRTQWAAQFAVASELCKRGHEVSFTMGNRTPLADLMVVSPVEKKMFLVDVKGLYRKNPWIISRKPLRAELFYVLAYVPDDAPNEFFILTQELVDHYIDVELHRLGRDQDYGMMGILWTQAAVHKDWNILPP